MKALLDLLTALSMYIPSFATAALKAKVTVRGVETSLLSMAWLMMQAAEAVIRVSRPGDFAPTGMLQSVLTLLETCFFLIPENECKEYVNFYCFCESLTISPD